MTGHAFQVLIEDDEIRASLTAIRSALARNGRFAFETRNPAARAWEGPTLLRVTLPSGHCYPAAVFTQAHRPRQNGAAIDSVIGATAATAVSTLRPAHLILRLAQILAKRAGDD